MDLNEIRKELENYKLTGKDLNLEQPPSKSTNIADPPPGQKPSADNKPKANRPLKTCRKCAMEIPKAAKICPYCHIKQGWTLPAKIFLAFIIFGVLSVLFAPSHDTSNSNTNNNSAPPVDKEEIKKETRALAGASIIRKAARNPESLKFSAVAAMDNGSVCYKFRSQNGFGGMNVVKAVLSGQDDTIITSEMDGFSEAWNKECARKNGKDMTDYIDMFGKQ